MFYFHPSLIPVFEMNQLNEKGKEIVYEDVFYPSNMFEWFPFDILQQHITLLHQFI
jgi:hypothetical protein